MDFSNKLTMPRVLFGAGMLVAFIGFLLPMTKINRSYFEEKKEEYEAIADEYLARAHGFEEQVASSEKELNGYEDYTGNRVPSLQEQINELQKKQASVRAQISTAPTQAEVDAKKQEKRSEKLSAPLSEGQASDFLAELTVRGNGLKNIDLSAPSRAEVEDAYVKVKADNEEEDFFTASASDVKSKEALEAEVEAIQATIEATERRIKANNDLLKKNRADAEKNKKIADKFTKKAANMIAKIEKIDAKIATAKSADSKAEALVAKVTEKQDARIEAARKKDEGLADKYAEQAEKIRNAADKKVEAQRASVEAKCTKIMKDAQVKYDAAMEKVHKNAQKIRENAQVKYEKMLPTTKENIRKYTEEPIANYENAKAESAEQIRAVIAEAEKLLGDVTEKIKADPSSVTEKDIENAKETAAEKIFAVKETVNKILFDAESDMAKAKQMQTIEENKLAKILNDAEDKISAEERHADKILEKAKDECEELRRGLQDIKDKANLKASNIEDKESIHETKAQEKADKAIEKAEALASNIADGALSVNVVTAGIVLNRSGFAYLATFLWVVCLACLAGVIVYILTHRIVYDYLCWLIGCGFGIASIAGLSSQFCLGLFSFIGAGSVVIFIGMTVALYGMVAASLKKK